MSTLSFSFLRNKPPLFVFHALFNFSPFLSRFRQLYLPPFSLLRFLFARREPSFQPLILSLSLSLSLSFHYVFAAVFPATCKPPSHFSTRLSRTVCLPPSFERIPACSWQLSPLGPWFGNHGNWEGKAKATTDCIAVHGFPWAFQSSFFCLQVSMLAQSFERLSRSLFRGPRTRWFACWELTPVFNQNILFIRYQNVLGHGNLNDDTRVTIRITCTSEITSELWAWWKIV